MNIALTEITPDQVIGLNRSVVEKARQWDSACQEKHVVRNPGGVQGCIGGIFQQLNPNGYVHLPLEKMAGLILYRIAQGQYFLDANKRTALLSTRVFLGNNSHNLRVDRDVVRDLMWGFAPPINDPTAPAKYKEEDAVKFIFDNIMPVMRP
jgi:hypothetical protein